VKTRTISSKKASKQARIPQRKFFTAEKSKSKKKTNPKQIKKALKSSPGSIRNFRQLFEHMNSCVAVYTASANGKDFIIRAFNRAAEKAENVNRKNIIGKSVLKVFPAVKDFGLFKVFQEVWETGKPQSHPISLYKDNRIEGWRENYVYKLPNGNIVAIYNDITKHKQTEEKLRESENFLASIFESIQDGISILDKKLTIIGVNEIHKKWYMHKAPLVGKKCYQAYHDRDKPCIACPSLKTIKTGKLAYKIVPKEAEGKIIGWLEVYSFPLKDSADGKIRGVIEYVRDITERKQTEQELEKEKYFNQTLVQKSPAFFVAIGTDGKTIMMNDSLLQALGYAEEEVIGADYLNTFVAEPDREKLAVIFKNLTKHKKSTINENLVLTKDGRELLVEWHGQPVFKENSQVDYFFGVGIDITEKKNAEEKLKNSEEKYRLTFASTSDIIFTLDTKLQITNITPSVEKVLGLNEESLIGKPVADLNIMTPDSLKKAIYYTKQIISGKFAPPIVYEFIGKDKIIRFMEVTASPIIRGNKIIGVTCVARNITDRVNTENILKESEENFRRSLDESPLGIRIVTADGKTIYANQAILDIYGYKTIEELNKTPLKKRYTPESYADYQARKALRDQGKESPTEYEINIVRKNGEIRNLQAFRKEIVWNGKKQFQVIYNDITKQKAAEKALQQSEEKYRTILETMEEGYYEVDLAGNTTFVNDAMCNIHGYSRQEIIGKNNRDYTDTETAKKVSQEFREIYLTGKPGKTSEHQIIRKDGSKIWIEASITPRKDAAGKIIGFKGIVRDISEKKQIEAERQENLKKMRKALQATINAMAVTVETRDPYTAGHQRRVAHLAQAIATEMKLSDEQIEGIRMASLIHDIGKISIPSEILTKPTRLTTLEYNLIKTHPVSGHTILKDIEFPWPIARVVLEHHERVNGAGYPHGLKENDILLESKILAVADVVEAISTHRPYRAAYSTETALEEILKNRGILYDAEVVDVCLRLFREKHYTMVA
jgi:PAS domain S-box-containing protein